MQDWRAPSAARAAFSVRDRLWKRDDGEEPRPVGAQLPLHLLPRTLAMAKRRLRLRALEVRSDGRWEGQLRLADCSRRSVHGHIGEHASAHNLPSHGIARLDDTHPELALD